MSSPVEQIKQRLSVVDVVQSYIKLDKAGANFKARCPFHSEKSASFFVSPARDIWHCFGCNRGGDIFGFVMEIEGVEFIEALKILGERAGIKLKMEDPRLRNERTRLLDLMKASSDFYRGELLKQKDVLDYLNKRGLKDSTIQSYVLGYAPEEKSGWRNLYEFLLDKGYSDEEMEKAGMIIKSDKFQVPSSKFQANYYDRFRGRIMFPLFDFSGRIVAFSGRLWPETLSSSTPGFGDSLKPGVAKYINSPQTILYDKSRILYGFDKAKTEIRKKDACVLVEGQMDVLMSHQADVLNSVAISGVGLTPVHLESIGRLTNNLIVSFDSDEAGLIAAGRGIDLALKKGFDVRVTTLPFGKDPAEVASKDPEAWQKAVSEARHIIDFYLKTLSEKISDSRELNRQVEKVVLPYVNLIESEIDKSHWIGEIARCLKIREEPIWEQLKKMKNQKPGFKEVPKPGFGKTRTRRFLLEERLLGLAFWQNDANMISDKKYFLFSEKNQAILQNFFSSPGFKKAEKSFPDDEKNYIERLVLENELSYGGMEAPQLENEKKILINDLERETIKEQFEMAVSNIRELEDKKDEVALNEALNKFSELSKKFNQLIHEIKKED
ncbi:MAG: DNA primase [Candidatus Tagabacteria bacterium]